MKKVLKFIKKHKLLVLLGILVVILIIFVAKLIFLFTDSDEVAIYGTRLETEDTVELDKSKTEKEIINKVNEQSDKTTVRVQGRIVNIMMDVKAEVSRDAAREAAVRALEAFSDDEKKYFDIQFFISKTGETEENKQFPIMGYKHHTKDGITWTKDR